MGWEGQPHASAASTPGKDLIPIVQEAGWAPGAENLVPTGIRSLADLNILIYCPLCWY